MISRLRLPFVALALAIPGIASAQSTQGFSLQPAPTPTPTSRAQGPVDTESGVVPVTPKVIGSATPTPSPTPTPVPTATSTPAPAPSTAAPRPAATTAVTRQPVERAPAQAERAQPAQTPTPQPTAAENEIPTVQPTDGTGPIPAPPPAPEATQAVDPAEIARPQESDSSWPWLLGGAALLALLASAAFAWSRRSAIAAPPEIERPVVQSAPAANIPAREAISLQCEVVKLTRSAMFATLKYRLTLINRTDRPLTEVAIGTDLVSAHAAAPMEQQVATEATALETRHTLARIAPRQNVTVEGSVQLPLASAQVIRQGRLPLLVPLMRVRVDGAGEGALVKTFVVGQGMPGGGRVQPFRLDDMPQSYQPIAQRELA